MPKLVLDIEEDFEFVLIGIASHAKDYHLCWAINNILQYDFTVQPLLEIFRKKSEASHFSIYTYTNEEEFRDYTLISNLSEDKNVITVENTLFSNVTNDESNHGENDFLIPELKNMDYFFIIRGEIREEEVEQQIQKIKELEMVLTAQKLNPHELKSKKNLIF
jgi:hypothetical protein